jgi:hypothetical protein
MWFRLAGAAGLCAACQESTVADRVMLPRAPGQAALAAAARGDDRGDRALFTHAPTDIANAAGVVPLGNLNPGGGHVLAVDHMYIAYPYPFTGGAYAYPVYAMADGEVVMISRDQFPGRPDFDYEIFIRHNHAVTSYFDHLHGLSARIMSFIASAPASAWVEPAGSDFRVLFLGQLGAPDPLPVHAGEQVAITKSYSYGWDVGVVDARVQAHFAGHGPRRYPDFQDFLKLLAYRIHPPFAGSKARSAVCFIEYMQPALKAAWFSLLLSYPKTCGKDAWDIDGRLRGAWFNPAVDAAAVPPLFELESAALSIIPYNLSPTTHLQIGVGSGRPYAALDPAGAYPQLRNSFIIAIDPAPGARLNPDPAAVRPRTGTVCYDLAYNNGGARYNTMLLHMRGARHVAIKYDPTPYAAPQCGSIALPEPDGSWVVYKR